MLVHTYIHTYKHTWYTYARTGIESYAYVLTHFHMYIHTYRVQTVGHIQVFDMIHTDTCCDIFIQSTTRQLPPKLHDIHPKESDRFFNVRIVTHSCTGYSHPLLLHSLQSHIRPVWRASAACAYRASRSQSNPGPVGGPKPYRLHTRVSIC